MWDGGEGNEQSCRFRLTGSYVPLHRKISKMRVFEHPVVTYLVIGLFSTCAAVILFKAGGSLAEITGQENTLLGVSFKAGGALAGFILIFLMSVKAIERLGKIDKVVKERRINMKLYLIGKPESFAHQDTTYVCKYSLFNEETGEKREFPAIHLWEAGYLTLHITEVGTDDWIAVRIENTQGKVWECDYFHSRAPKTEVQLLVQ